MIRMSSASLSEAVRTLHPGYFALVMATGIVSVGLRSHDRTTLSATLMWLAGGCYLVLLVVSAWRIAVFPTEVRRDLADPSRGFGFFTFVAGTNVLGARFALEGYISAAAVLLVVGGLAWLLLGYLVPWTAVLGHRHRPETVGANGTWFIWVVASQSVAVLAAVLEPAVSTGQRELALPSADRRFEHRSEDGDRLAGHDPDEPCAVCSDRLWPVTVAQHGSPRHEVCPVRTAGSSTAARTSTDWLATTQMNHVPFAPTVSGR